MFFPEYFLDNIVGLSFHLRIKIMARKSKGFGEPLSRKQCAKGEQKSLNKLAKRAQQAPLKEIVSGSSMLINPKGETKMSETLHAFVEPYLDVVTELKQRQKLFSVAILAWNLALLPEDQQQQEMEGVIDHLSPGQGSVARQEARTILEELIQRKQKRFSAFRQSILDFELQETRNDYHLAVISLPLAEDVVEHHQ